MKTQVEQIKAARRAYVMPINPTWTRWQVYLDSGNGLAVLWPSDAHLHKSKELLPGQIYYRSDRWKFPAYHFHITGFGFSKYGEIRDALHAINPEIQCFDLKPGFNP